MKTLCVVLVVLSLTSVCQPAPLTCDKVLKKVDNNPDLSGRWYFIALSSNICWLPALIYSVFWPSLSMDITPKDKPNTYNINYRIKMYGYCTNETERLLYESNSVTNIDSNGDKQNELEPLLQSGCSDCLVLKMESTSLMILFSRRTNITAAELKDFEAQADCLGWRKPLPLNTDHEYEKCLSLDEDDDADDDEELDLPIERLKNTYTVLLSCFVEDMPYYARAAYESVQEMWNSLG